MVRHFLQTLLMTLLLATFCRAVEVAATLDATEVNPGDGVIYTIQIQGGQTQQLEFPEIKNLTVHFQGQNQMINMMNGRTESVQTFQYVIGSYTPGTYTIPAIPLTIAGQTYTTQPLTLKVIDDGTSPQVPKPKADTPDKASLLTLELAAPERQHAYISEIVPVIIRAWFPPDSQLQRLGGIQPVSKGFTLHNVSQQAQQSQEMRDGKPYIALTWFGGISATKAGKQDVSLAIEAVFQVADDSQPSLRMRNRPSMRIGGNFIAKEVTLTSANQPIEVRALPSEGKPENFSGAVGDFQFDGIEIPQQWKTGEPQKVALRIKGRGNFAIMQAPPLTPVDLWNTYPGQDRFSAGDEASFSGNKIFQYNAIPRKAGNFPVTFTLHYFDPNKGSYQSLQSPTQTISVTGKDLIDEPKRSEKNDQEAPAVDPATIPAPSRENDSLYLAANPLENSNTFLFSLVGAGLLTLAGPMLALLKTRLHDPQRRQSLATKQEIANATKLATIAYQSRDTAAYFAATRRVLQWHLASAWKLKPEAITLADVQLRCASDSPVVAFFREADRYSYGAAPAADDWSTFDVRYQQALLSIAQP